MNIRTKRAAGFTLVEVMIAVSLVGMLAGMAVPTFVKARDSATLNVIKANLRLIEDVKQQWALDTRAARTDVPLDVELHPYFRGEQLPKALVGEVYQLNSVDTPASAVIPVALAGMPAGSSITL